MCIIVVAVVIVFSCGCQIVSVCCCSEVQAFVSSLEVVMSSSAELVDEITNDSRWEWLSLICAEEDVAPEISLQVSFTHIVAFVVTVCFVVML